MRELGKCSDKISELMQAASALEGNATWLHTASACEDVIFAQVVLPSLHGLWCFVRLHLRESEAGPYARQQQSGPFPKHRMRANIPRLLEANRHLKRTRRGNPLLETGDLDCRTMLSFPMQPPHAQASKLLRYEVALAAHRHGG